VGLAWLTSGDATLDGRLSRPRLLAAAVGQVR
jgi:hypothetical protein